MENNNKIMTDEVNAVSNEEVKDNNTCTEENSESKSSEVVEQETPSVDEKYTEDEKSSISDEEAAAKAQELMRLISDPKVLRAYQDIRSDFYGKRKQDRQVSKKDVKKKKAKRRMAKKSKRS